MYEWEAVIGNEGRKKKEGREEQQKDDFGGGYHFRIAI